MQQVSCVKLGLSLTEHMLELVRYFAQDQQTELEQLNAENSSLRARLHNVAHSPLSDSEKEQLLLATTGRQHSSAPASMMATDLQGDITLADTSCSTPDWDKQSTSSLSEVSVACLQDRIMQMEETHYRCVACLQNVILAVLMAVTMRSTSLLQCCTV